MLTIAFVLSLLSSQIFAEDFRFQVKEKGLGDPIRRVEVKVGEQLIYSDREGWLEIQLNNNDELLRFYHSEYESLELSPEELRTTIEEDGGVFLIPDVTQQTISIKAKAKPGVSKKELTATQVREVAPGGDPVKAVFLLPGVQRADFNGPGGGGLVVRGSGPEDSKFYRDQVQLPFIFHPIGDISVVPELLLDKVSFSSGGFSPQYGDGTGGILILRTKDQIATRPKTEVLANLPLFVSVFHERPLGDGSISVSARSSLLQYIIPPILEQTQGSNFTVVPYFRDFHVQHTLKRDDGYINYGLFYSFDGLRLALPSEAAKDASGTIEVDVKLSYINPFVSQKKRLSKNWSYYGTLFYLYFNQDSTFLDNVIKLNINTIGLPLTFTHRRSRHEKDYVGVDLNFTRAEVDLKVPAPARDQIFQDFEDVMQITQKTKVDVVNAAMWWASDFYWEPITVTPGLRVYYEDSIKEASADPRLDLRYKLNKKHTLKASTGLFSQPPAPDQSDEKFGNPDLTYKRSIHYVLGIEDQWADGWESDFQIYYKKFFRSFRGDGTAVKNNGEGSSFGGEIFIKKNLTSRLFGWLSYTLSLSKEKDPETKKVIPSNYDTRNILSLVSSYLLTPVWSLGSRLTFRSGSPYTPFEKTVYNANLDKYQRILNRDLINSKYRNNQSTFSIFVKQKLYYPTWSLEMRYGLEEIILSKDTSAQQFNYDFSESDEVTTIPFIPFFEIRGLF